MIADVIYSLLRVSLKSFVVFAVLVGLFALYMKIKIRRSIEFYKAQGIPFHYQAYNLIGSVSFGSPPGGFDEEKAKRGIFWLPRVHGLTRVAKDHLGLDEYNGADLPIVGVTLFGEVKFHTADPDIIRDIMTVNNKYIDKDGLTDIAMRPYMGNTFLFSRADENWSRKRKGASHAFYKDRLKLMLYTMQEVTVKTFKKWIEGIEASKDGKTVIDISRAFMEIFSRNIITISFGDDISNLFIEQ